MSTNPYGSVRNDSLVNTTALDTGQTELIFTREQLDKMPNTLIRRLAAELNTSEIHGKKPRFVITSALACQRSLKEYEEG